MVLRAGCHPLGTERGRIVLRTSRDGLASQAGHDLSIEVTRWSGELTVADDLSPTGLTVRIDMNSLVVREGTGGLKPLTDRDRREIAVTARKVLGADRHPEAVFSASAFEPGSGGGGGVIAGTLTIAGAGRPVRLQLSESRDGVYQAATSVLQSAFGVKPYTALLGALRVRDAVDIEVDVNLSEQGDAPVAGP
jgi:polyisoprenoid-binding protein YceI